MCFNFKCYVALPKLLSPPTVVVCFYHLIALTIFFLNNEHVFSVFVYNDCFAHKNSIGIFSLEVWKFLCKVGSLKIVVSFGTKILI